MDYQVGSLADMISGSGSKKKKSRKSEAANGGVKIQFQKVEATPILSTDDKKGTKKRKSDPLISSSSKKVKRIMTLNDAENSSAMPTVKESVNSTHAKKRLKMKDLPKPTKKGDKGEKIESVRNEEHETRTIFVGNLFKTTSKSDLKKLFRKFGVIETVRLRGAPVADPRTPKKVAIIKSEFHPDRTNIHAYVRFEKVESARKALAMNGTIEKKHTLRVDMAAGAEGGDINNPKKAVFVGNIKFTIEEDDLRKVFETCGEIDSIRLVRDGKTGMGKGFGFINFKNTGSVELALKLDGEEMQNRPIRVNRCDGRPKTKKSRGKKKDKLVNDKGKPKHKFEKKTNGDDTIVQKREAVADSTEFKGQEIVGAKVKKNKKKKQNKSEQKKKVMLNKLEINPMKRLKKLKKQKGTPSP